QAVANRGREGLVVPGRRSAEVGLEFGEGQLDWIEVGRVGREKAEYASGGLDGCPRRLVLVDAEVVEDDGRAGRQTGGQPVAHPGHEDIAVQCAFEDEG